MGFSVKCALCCFVCLVAFLFSSIVVCNVFMSVSSSYDVLSSKLIIGPCSVRDFHVTAGYNLTIYIRTFTEVLYFVSVFSPDIRIPLTMLQGNFCIEVEQIFYLAFFHYFGIPYRLYPLGSWLAFLFLNKFYSLRARCFELLWYCIMLVSSL